MALRERASASARTRLSRKAFLASRRAYQSRSHVLDVPGEDLGHPDEEPLLVVAERLPRAHRIEQRPRLPVGAGHARPAARVDAGLDFGVVGHAGLLTGREVPLADAVGVVAVLDSTSQMKPFSNGMRVEMPGKPQ